MEFKIKALDADFRVKKMNAIEALALKNVLDFDNYETTVKVFKIILEQLEIKVGDVWLAVKEKDREVYLPAGINENVFAVNELIDKFLTDYLKPLFRKSGASKN